MSSSSRMMIPLCRWFCAVCTLLWLSACTADNPDAFDGDAEGDVDMARPEPPDGADPLPDLSTLDPNLAIAAECQRLAGAVCDRLASCSTFGLRTYYGDVATCKSRVRITCDPYVKLAGSSWTLARLRACTMGYAQGTCDDYFAPGGPAACRPQPGLLENGAACANSNQCKSANCNLGVTGCGTCTTVGKLGEACNALQPCDLGLSCAANKCAAQGDTGATCGIGRPACRGGLYCTAGSCTAQLAVDAACDPASGLTECDPRQGLYCDGAMRKCVAAKVADPAEACGTVAGVNVVCAASGTCSGMAPNRQCVAAAKDGAACGGSTPNNLSCVSPAYCGTNQCRIFDPSTCK